jgi:hypothetical protein
VTAAEHQPRTVNAHLPGDARPPNRSAKWLIPTSSDDGANDRWLLLPHANEESSQTVARVSESDDTKQ